MKKMDEATALMLIAEMVGIEDDNTAPAAAKCAYYSLKVLELLGEITAHATDDDAIMLRMLKETLETKVKAGVPYN